METKMEITRTAKEIHQVPENETIRWFGDLTIIGQVGKGAQIEVKDGSLIIGGDIQEGVTIRMILSDQAKKNIEVANPNIYWDDCANFNFGDNIFLGGVKLENRIFTDGMVKRENGKYKIINANKGQLEALYYNPNAEIIPTKKVEATIDYNSYEGYEIIVEGAEVFVDGKLATLKDSYVLKEKPKMVMIGQIHDRVHIESVGETKICGNIGKSFYFSGEDLVVDGNIENGYIDFINGNFRAKNIGEDTKIYARGAINVAEVGEKCVLSSSQGDVEAQHVEMNGTVKARGTIYLRSAALNCTVTSSQGDITIQEKADNMAKLTARGNIKLGSLGGQSKVISEQGNIEIAGAAETTTIEARGSIEMQAIAKNSIIRSTQSHVTAATVATGVKIKARGDINIKGECHTDMKNLISFQGKIKLKDGTYQQPTLRPTRRNDAPQSFNTQFMGLPVNGNSNSIINISLFNNMDVKPNSNISIGNITGIKFGV